MSLLSRTRSSTRSLASQFKGKAKDGSAAPGQNFRDGQLSASRTDCSACALRRDLSTSASSHAAANASTSSRSSALIRPMRLVPPRPVVAPTRERKPSHKPGKPREHEYDDRHRFVARLYALRAPPPASAIAALGNRISPDLLGTRSGKDQASLLKSLEQCCTCQSFWQTIAEDELQPSVATSTAPADDLEALPAKYTNFLDADRLHNESLSVLGNNLLGVFALEWLETKYPHLPERVLKAALTLYVGPRTCADIATKQWGITLGQAARHAFIANPTGSHKPGQPSRGIGEGNRAGAGLLRWGRPKASALDALAARDKADRETDSDSGKTPMALETALGDVTRAIVGLIFQEHGFGAVRQFVHANFMARQADLTSLLKFSDPKYALSSTLAKYGRPQATTRLLAETGRLSIAPIFVTGVFSDTTKLGEGYGSSLKMAEYRACEDAMRRIYLSPLASDPLGSSEQTSSVTELPTDTLVYPGKTLSRQRKLADEEVLWQSSGRSGVVVSAKDK